MVNNTKLQRADGSSIAVQEWLRAVKYSLVSLNSRQDVLDQWW